MDPEKISKWDLEMLKAKYDTLGIDFEKINCQIRDIIIKSLIAIEPHIYNKSKKLIFD